jgi:subtilisin family serine protease/subtilisin-like proprotein convertase family protein
MKQAREVFRIVSVAGLIGLMVHQACADGEVFTFKLPTPLTVALETGQMASNRVATLATASDAAAPHVFGRRVVVQVLEDWSDAVVRELSVAKAVEAETVNARLKIFELEDAWDAARTAQRIAVMSGVVASYPIVSKPVGTSGRYAPYPYDYNFVPVNFGNVVGQWYLENRDLATGQVLGPDLNVRAAWPVTRGAGVTIAVADGGVELGHTDLKDRTGGAPHWNFAADSTNAAPAGTNAFWAHGTEVAGLAAATMDNLYGGAGVAPEARLASWVIFNSDTSLVTDDRLARMFSYASNVVAVQSHSWSAEGIGLGGPTALEGSGIDLATTLGRDGKGVVLVRSAGNDRKQGASANDDGYSNDPRVITVGAVDRQGHWASYSEPGSSLLVAVPSGDEGQSGLFTTDLTGPAGVNQIGFFFQPFLSDYAFNSLGFSGTSASTPLVSGVAALVLGANPSLTYREVQRIVALSARHFDHVDPTLQTNQAGLVVSDNTGYGVPDAGEAVRLATVWAPPGNQVRTLIGTSETPKPIPDGGLRLVLTGQGIPSEATDFLGLPTTGAHPDEATPDLALVDAGLGTNYAGLDVAGKAVLVERGTNDFSAKLALAQQAGARFVVLYNFAVNSDPLGCPGGDQLCLPGGTDTNLVPGLFIGRTDGLRLKAIFATNAAARARLELNPAVQTFVVSDTLVLQHVGARVRTDHPLRGDLRITVVSPAGTRSILQRYNADTSAGPVDWIYWSTHHLGESSAGTWRLEVTDEYPGAVGNLLGASLILSGRPIVDSDKDGLDDAWEELHFHTLARGPKDDPDKDGYNNAREQFAGTDPSAADLPFKLDLSGFTTGLVRLSWPSTTNLTYQVWAGTDPGVLSLQTNLPGRFPETEWFAPRAPAVRFFQVRTAAQ